MEHSNTAQQKTTQMNDQTLFDKLSELRSILQGELFTRSDPDNSKYLTLTQTPFNYSFRGQPIAIACVKTVDDIRACISFCRKNEVPLAVAGGCHGSQCMVTNSLVVFLNTHMAQVEIDLPNKIVIVGGEKKIKHLVMSNHR
jgi:FAD/FMN-containing dehydrogenase